MRKLALLFAITSFACTSPTEDDAFGVRIEGRVETAGGAPVAGYFVKTDMYIDGSCTSSQFVPDASAVTDANGNFAFDAPAFREEMVCVRPHVRATASTAIVALGDSVKVMARGRPYLVVTDTLRLP
jgi:hypothetical protein